MHQMCSFHNAPAHAQARTSAAEGTVIGYEAVKMSESAAVIHPIRPRGNLINDLPACRLPSALGGRQLSCTFTFKEGTARALP